jgi:hypothetical protein
MDDNNRRPPSPASLLIPRLLLSICGLGAALLMTARRLGARFKLVQYALLRKVTPTPKPTPLPSHREHDRRTDPPSHFIARRSASVPLQSQPWNPQRLRQADSWPPMTYHQQFQSRRNMSTAFPLRFRHRTPIADSSSSYEALPPNFSLTANMLAGAFAGIAVRLRVRPECTYSC